MHMALQPILTKRNQNDQIKDIWALYRTAYRILEEKLEGKAKLGRPWHRYESNIKMDHRKIG
jgi:hypothetical protein